MDANRASSASLTHYEPPRSWCDGFNAGREVGQDAGYGRGHRAGFGAGYAAALADIAPHVEHLERLCGLGPLPREVA